MARIQEIKWLSADGLTMIQPHTFEHVPPPVLRRPVVRMPKAISVLTENSEPPKMTLREYQFEGEIGRTAIYREII